MTLRSTATIEKVFEILKNQKQEKVVEKLTSIPMEMQFAPSAVSMGYGSTYGMSTSNNAEVVSPMSAEHMHACRSC